MKNSLFLAGHLLFTFGTFISNGSPSTPFDSSKINLQPVFVSASKWNENKNSTTKLITKIRQADVAIQNPQTAADLLAVSGEVFIQKSQLGGGSPMIRGFSTNRLLYSLDGIRLNNAIYRGGNIHNVIALDPFSMSNTEILFGPGSVTYGSDAIGAVMSFSSLRHNHSIQKKLLVKGKTNISYSSANQEASYHYDILVAHEKWSYISSLSKVHYSDLKMGRKVLRTIGIST